METPVFTVRPVPIEWHDGLSIYASAAHLRSVGDEFGWLGGFDARNTLRCVLPFTVVRKAIFRMVRFRIETLPVGGELSVAEETAFLDQVIAHFRARGADMVIPATTNTIFRAVPAGAISAPYGTHVIDLTQTKEALWKDMHASHRNAVSKSERKGVKISHGLEHLPAVHEMITVTLKRTGLGFMSFEKLDKMVRELGPHIRIYVAEFEGKLQGCAICPFSLHSAYYLYAGSAERPVNGAMKQLNWEAMRSFQDLGCRRWDFVGARIDPDPGSKQEGLSIFKERFGGRLVKGHMWKYSFHPLKFMLYQLAARLRRGGDIVDEERRRLARPRPAPPAAGAPGASGAED